MRSRKKNRQKPKKSEFVKLDISATFAAGMSSVSHSYIVTSIENVAKSLCHGIKSLCKGVAYSAEAIAERPIKFLGNTFSGSLIGAYFGVVAGGESSRYEVTQQYKTKLRTFADENLNCRYIDFPIGDTKFEDFHCQNKTLENLLTSLAYNMTIGATPPGTHLANAKIGLQQGAIVGGSVAFFGTLYHAIYHKQLRKYKNELKLHPNVPVKITPCSSTFFNKIGSNLLPEGKIPEFLQTLSFYTSGGLIIHLMKMGMGFNVALMVVGMFLGMHKTLTSSLRASRVGEGMIALFGGMFTGIAETIVGMKFKDQNFPFELPAAMITTTFATLSLLSDFYKIHYISLLDEVNKDFENNTSASKFKRS